MCVCVSLCEFSNLPSSVILFFFIFSVDAQRLSVHVPMPHACAATLGGVTFLTAHASAQHKRIVFGICGFGTLNRSKGAFIVAFALAWPTSFQDVLFLFNLKQCFDLFGFPKHS